MQWLVQRVPLTNTEIKQAKPRQKEYNLANGAGLALRIKPNGSKYWIFNFARLISKKRANLSFGAYPSLSLANARKLRDEAQGLLAQSIDQKEHKDEQELVHKKVHQDTLKHVAKQWLVVKKRTISENHAQKILDSFELHIFPTLDHVADSFHIGQGCVLLLYYLCSILVCLATFQK